MKTNKKGAIALILVILAVIILALGGYAYYKGNNANPKESFYGKITGGLTKVVESVTPEVKSKEINVEFNIDANFDYSKNDKKTSSGELLIKNAKIITLDNSLKQSLKIGKIYGKIMDNGEKEEISLKDLALISDNEIVYFYAGEGIEKIIKFYKKLSEQNPMISIETLDSLDKILQKNKYVKIDNSKPVLRVLGNLSKNELIKKIAVGLVTSNPGVYYKKNGVAKELKKVFISDKILNYLFKKGSYNEETKQTILNLDEKICKDFAPVAINIVKEFDEKNSNLKLSEVENKCNDSIAQLNSFLTVFSRIYVKGDMDSGNFTFVLAIGNIVKIEKTFEKHILNSWNLDIHVPNNMLDLTASGDLNGIKSSLLKINFEQNGIKIAGEIKDGNGKINIDVNIEGINNTKGFISFEDYKPTYNIVSKSELQKSELVAKGDYKQGKITTKVGEKQVMLLEYSKGKFLFNVNNDNQIVKFIYKDNKFDLTLEGADELKGKAHYEEGKFNFSSSIKKYNGITESNFDYNNGKVNGSLKNSDINAILKGEIKNLGDFNFEFNEEKEKINIVAKAEKIDENNCQFTLLAKEKNTEKVNVNITRKTGEKDSFKTCELKGKIIVSDTKEKMNFNINSSYKKDGVKYEIPKDYEELNIKLQEISPLPDFNSFNKLGKIKIGSDKIIIGAAVLGGVSASSMVIYSNQIKKARDSLRISDIKNMQSALEMVYQDEGEYPSEEDFEEKTKVYLSRIPKDPLDGQTKNGCKFGYKYEVGPDLNGIENGAYRLSTCLESDKNLAKNDGGIYPDKYDVGNLKK